MAQSLGDAVIEVGADLDNLDRDLLSGFKSSERLAERQGEKIGDGLTRGIDGRLRNSRGQFVGQGENSGKGFGDGFSKGAEGSAKGAADGFSGKLGGALKGGIAAVAVAGAAALAAGFLGALDKEKQVDRISASLALTDKQSALAGEVAGSLYAGAWGESMEEVSSAVEAVISSIDGMANASSSELQGVTASILDIATAFDQDVTEAARNAGILMKTGLAGDATEAADLITRSMQVVPKALRGGISDATEEYSQFFAAVGLSGPEAFKLLTDGAEDGQFGIDKMGDAIKEFTIRATDMSSASVDAFDAIGLDAQEMANNLLAGGDTARGAFDSIVEGLLGIKDPAARANAAIALFGTPLEDIGVRDIPQFLSSLRDVDGGLAGVAGAAATMGDTLNDNVSTRLEAMKRGAQTLLTEGIGRLFTAFDQGSAVASRLGDAFSGTVAAFEPVRAAFAALVTEAGSRLGPVFAQVASTFQTTLLPALNDFGEAMAPIVKFIVKNVGPQIINVFEAIGGVLGGLIDIVAGVFSTVAAVIRGDWDGAWEGVLKILGGALKVVKAGLGLLLGIFGTSFSQIGRVASRVWENIGRFFREGTGRILNSMRNFISRVISDFISLNARAVLAVRGLWDQARTAFNFGVTRLTIIASSGLSKVVGFFSRIPGQITRAIGNLGSLLYGAGQNVVQGLINGITSMIGRVGSSMSNIAATIRSYLPFSPAKEGPLSGVGNPENSGRKIVDMIGEGISQNVNIPARAMNRALAPLSSTNLVPLSRTSQQAGSSSAPSTVAPVNRAGDVSVVQQFFGPTTSGGRLQEMNWNIRYATQARSETIGGVAR